MNKLERAQVAALAQHVRIPQWAYGALTIKNLIWRLEQDPKAGLSPNEKYCLALCLWRYRRKLGGLVGFELPKEEPLRSDFFPPRDATLQESLL